MAGATATTLATMMAIKGGAELFGAIAGHYASKEDFENAKKAFDAAMAEINAIGAGPDLTKEILYKKFKLAGVLTPEVEREIDVGVSKVAQIKEDPRFRKAQVDALSELEKRAKTGLTAQERLARDEELRASQRAASSQRAGVLENLRARGLAESGAGLMAQLQPADALAEQQAQAAARRSAAAEARSLQAITQAGALAGQIRGQEFDISRTKAAAEDELNRFRVSAAMNREQRRVMYENSARQFNLTQQQHIMDLNTSTYNQEQLRRRQAEQTEYENQLRRAQLRSNMFGQQQQMYQQRGQATQQAYGAMASGLGAIGAGMYGAGFFGPGATPTPTPGTTTPGLGAVPKTTAGTVDFGLDQNLLTIDPYSYKIGDTF